MSDNVKSTSPSPSLTSVQLLAQDLLNPQGYKLFKDGDQLPQCIQAVVLGSLTIKRFANDLKSDFCMDATHPQSLNCNPQAQKALTKRSFLHSYGSKTFGEIRCDLM